MSSRRKSKTAAEKEAEEARACTRCDAHLLKAVSQKARRRRKNKARAPGVVHLGRGAGARTTIGRLEGAVDVVMDSEGTARMISRKHATLECRETAGGLSWFVEDNMSTNGVFVNDVKRMASELTDGDFVTLGGAGTLAEGERYPQPDSDFRYVFRIRSRNVRARSPESDCEGDDAVGRKAGDGNPRNAVDEIGAAISVLRGSAAGGSDDEHQSPREAQKRQRSTPAALHEQERTQAAFGGHDPGSPRSSFPAAAAAGAQSPSKSQAPPKRKKVAATPSARRTVAPQPLAQLHGDEEIRVKDEAAEEEEEEAPRTTRFGEEFDPEDERLAQLRRDLEETNHAIAEIRRQRQTADLSFHERVAQIASQVAVECASSQEHSSSRRAGTSGTAGAAPAGEESGDRDDEEERRDQARLEAEMMRKEFVSSISEEFVCSICQETLIEPRTIGCGHSFCETCLGSWTRQKNICPVCREPIIGRPIIALALANVLARTVEKMPADDRREYQQRLAALQQKRQLEAAACSRVTSFGANEDGMTRRLRASISAARRQGVRFLSIAEEWTAEERKIFSQGVSRYRNAAPRILYCESVGLTERWALGASTDAVLLAARNLGILFVAGSSQSDIGQIRARLADFIINPPST